MRFRFLTLLVFILLFSCSQKDRLPEKLSNKILQDSLMKDASLTHSQYATVSSNTDLNDLTGYVMGFETNDPAFDLRSFEEQWKSSGEKKNISKWNNKRLKQWIDATGLLLELTGKTLYAEELENILLNTAGGDVSSYVITKNIDNIYVNLFQSVELNYRHTMGGNVKFRLEADYPESGSIKLHFGMTERRYMEVFIRIPTWAEGTTVTVKQVKYFAPPGGYCKIAKKWKEGDVVEIEFPENKISEYFAEH